MLSVWVLPTRAKLRGEAARWQHRPGYPRLGVHAWTCLPATRIVPCMQIAADARVECDPLESLVLVLVKCCQACSVGPHRSHSDTHSTPTRRGTRVSGAMADSTTISSTSIVRSSDDIASNSGGMHTSGETTAVSGGPHRSSDDTAMSSSSLMHIDDYDESAISSGGVHTSGDTATNSGGVHTSGDTATNSGGMRTRSRESLVASHSCYRIVSRVSGAMAGSVSVQAVTHDGLGKGPVYKFRKSEIKSAIQKAVRRQDFREADKALTLYCDVVGDKPRQVGW
jgi:hypothetical protein